MALSPVHAAKNQPVREPDMEKIDEVGKQIFIELRLIVILIILTEDG